MSEEQPKEVRKLVTLAPGQALRIRRGDLAGWIVEVDHGPACIGQQAAFSEGADIIEWLANSIKISTGSR